MGTSASKSKNNPNDLFNKDENCLKEPFRVREYKDNTSKVYRYLIKYRFPRFDETIYSPIKSIIVAENDKKNVEQWLNYLDANDEVYDIDVWSLCDDSITFDDFRKAWRDDFFRHNEKLMIASQYDASWYIVFVKPK